MNADGQACIQADDATYRTCVVSGNGKPHAVTTVGFPPWSITANYGYDADGSAIVITRTVAGGITYALSYDADNRLKEVRGNNTLSATFRYDGDGNRVLGIVAGVTTTYVGHWYEYTTAGTSYYYFAGQRVAMRTSSGVSYIHGDHLGSAVNTTGDDTSSQLYYPWGTRRGSNTVTTPYRFTGQREESTIELYFYNARWYDAVLGRFVQADSVVPQPGDPQSLNRYSYVKNNPVRYADRSGHYVDEGNFCLQSGCSYDPSMEYYTLWMAGGSVRVDTYHLTPAVSKAIFGVSVPQRVSMGTVVGVSDPHNRGPLLMALAGGVAGMVANLPMPEVSTQIYAPSSQLPDIYGDPGPGPAPSNPAGTVAQQSPNAIGHWGEQQVGQRLPVDVGQFRVAGGQRVYDGNMPTTDQYVEIKTTTRGVVNLDAHIRGQIAFDAAQQTRPLSIFVNGSPSQGLQVELSKGGHSLASFEHSLMAEGLRR